MKKNVVINYAKRLHAKRSLTLPVNLEIIAKEYADLKFMPIPFDIDGVSANLKMSGVRPCIIVNDERPKKRQRFTLAHEIGHVLIPWHMGTIFDIIDAHSSNGIDYWDMEAEANAFATELLMPSFWVLELIRSNDDIAEINETIIKQADVSALAATLRLRSELPPGYVFIVKNNNEVVTYSGRSDGTHSSAATTGEYCNIEQEYPHAEDIYWFETTWDSYTWVKMPDSIQLPSIECRPWRDVLDEILRDISEDSERRGELRNQLNGVLGSANSLVKRESPCEEKLFSVIMQRLSSKVHLKEITGHSLFQEFLVSKIRDLISK